MQQTIERRKRNHLEAKLSSSSCLSVRQSRTFSWPGDAREWVCTSFDLIRQPSKSSPPGKWWSEEDNDDECIEKLARRRSQTNKPHAETPKFLSDHRPPSRMPKSHCETLDRYFGLEEHPAAKKKRPAILLLITLDPCERTVLPRHAHNSHHVLSYQLFRKEVLLC